MDKRKREDAASNAHSHPHPLTYIPSEKEDAVRHLSFLDGPWLQHFGMEPNAMLEYFAHSPFYDKASNNEHLRAQGVGPEHLLNMTGLEFSIDPTALAFKPVLYVIKKQFRTSRTQARVLQIYYIIDGTIYQSPNLDDLLTSRADKIGRYLRKAFKILAPEVGYDACVGPKWEWARAPSMDYEEDETARVPGGVDSGVGQSKVRSATVREREDAWGAYLKGGQDLHEVLQDDLDAYVAATHPTVDQV